MSRFHELVDDFLRQPQDPAVEAALQQALDEDEGRLQQLTAQGRVDRLLRPRGESGALVERIMRAAYRRRRRRRSAAAAALLAVAAAALFLVWTTTMADASAGWGRVVAQTGPTAWLERDGRRQTIATGDRLLPGDELIVEAPGELDLVDAVGARLSLTGQLGLAAVDEAEVARLRRGRVAVDLDGERLTGPWRLTTPQARCTVTGTRFTVAVVEDRSLIVVDEGSVLVEGLADGRQETLAAGDRRQFGVSEEAAPPPSAVDPPATTDPLPLAEVLVAHWRFDDRQGAPLTDSGPFGIHATVPPRAQWTEGIAGSALLLDGRTAMSVAYHEALEPAAGTVSFWLRPERLFSEQCDALPSKLPHCLWTNLDWSGRRGYQICHPAHNDGHEWGLRLGHGLEGDAGHRKTSHAYSEREPAQVGEWVQVAATWDAQRARLYLDGRLVVETSLATPPLIASGKAIHGFGYWQGAVDELRVYRRVLSADELTTLVAQPGE